MASSPEAGPRHVGRVIDPTVREDGELEPDVQLEPPPEQSAEPSGFTDEAADGEHAGEPAVSTADSAEDSVTVDEPAVGRGSAVRERLLARAALAQKTRSGRAPPRVGTANDASGSEAAKTQADGPLELELELVAPAPGLRQPPPAPVLGRPGQLSPTMLAVFGTLLGLATVASLVALAIQLDSRRQPATTAVLPPAASAEKAVAATPGLRPQKRQRQKLPGPWRVRDAKDDPATRLVEGQIGTVPFLKAIQNAGVPAKEAYRVLKALGGVRNLDKCDKSDRFSALIERSTARLKAFEYLVSQEEVYQAKEEGGLLVGKKLDLKVERTQIKGALVLDGTSVDAAAETAGLDSGLAKVLAKALDGHMSLDELERGDVIRVIVQEVSVLGEFSRYSGVEAIELQPSDPRAKPLRIYWFNGASSHGYFDASGRAPYEGGWRKPIKDAPVTSRFNPKRLHPVLKKIMPHNGTDFSAPAGAPVGASSYGTVSFIAYAGASGNLVKIEHPNGIVTGYAHLSRFAEGLRVSDKVKRLQLIGYVGSTGRSTGPHLHFSAEKNDRFFDAETLNLDGMQSLPPEERDAFAKLRSEYDALLNGIPAPERLPARAIASTQNPEAFPGSTEHAAAKAELENGPGGLSETEGAASARPVARAGDAPQPNQHLAEPSRKPSSSAVYLSDKELMKLQTTTDDGEVSE